MIQQEIRESEEEFNEEAFMDYHEAMEYELMRIMEAIQEALLHTNQANLDYLMQKIDSSYMTAKKQAESIMLCAESLKEKPHHMQELILDTRLRLLSGEFE